MEGHLKLRLQSLKNKTLFKMYDSPSKQESLNTSAHQVFHCCWQCYRGGVYRAKIMGVMGGNYSLPLDSTGVVTPPLLES